MRTRTSPRPGFSTCGREAITIAQVNRHCLRFRCAGVLYRYRLRALLRGGPEFEAVQCLLEERGVCISVEGSDSLRLCVHDPRFQLRCNYSRRPGNHSFCRGLVLRRERRNTWKLQRLHS